MAKSKLQYVVDESGRKRAVVLGIKEYKELLSRIEDLEDALELDEAIKNAEGFRDYREIRKELQEEDLL
ncbi:MAG: hypothetical protein L0177_13345 [Chloroflexi bacterium]|nr:hypothetical protein [Chloroflexota bacterium]